MSPTEVLRILCWGRDGTRWRGNRTHDMTVTEDVTRAVKASVLKAVLQVIKYITKRIQWDPMSI